MRCPTLAELPAPPPGRTGWPWTDECSQLPDVMPTGRPWPRISILTPSYDQGEFIEETIRSILLQGYPDLEYAIMDGGSNDGSVAIIRKYARWLSHWESGPDGGQAAAINKGLHRATGELFQFVNSDDRLRPGATATIARRWNGSCVAGRVRYFGLTVDAVANNFGLTPYLLINEINDRSRCRYHQPGIWLSTKNVTGVGGLNEELDYLFDLELIARYFERYPLVEYIDDVLLDFRLHSSSKSVGEAREMEGEYGAARLLLSRTLTSKPLKRYALTVGKRHIWHRQIARTLASRQGTSLGRLTYLLKEWTRAPAARTDRFFLGAVRRIAQEAIRRI